MRPNCRRLPWCQSGFTLVELMVGLAIGMLATLVIVQVISVFEAQSRSTTGSADAQTNGGIALYTISHDLQLAGYSLMSTSNGNPLACTSLTINGTADVPDGITDVTNRLSPVVITDGITGTGENASPSDAITIRYGDATMGGVPAQTQNILPTVGYPLVVPVGSNFGCQVPNPIAAEAALGLPVSALIVDGGSCYMSNVTAVSATGATSPPPVPNVTLSNVPTTGNSGVNLACLGTWHEITYRVNNGNLESCDLPVAQAKNGGNCDPTNFNTPNDFTTRVVGIVNLQAQYGISQAGLSNSDPNYNRIVQWVDATAATGWNAPSVANRNLIKAVRIAVVARNAKRETSVVTSACSSTTAANPTGLCAWDATSALPTPPLVPPFVASPAPTIDLSASDPEWLQYRYRVFETIIPLRNVIWTKD
jgi:type IV pilus assembly protein PilW